MSLRHDSVTKSNRYKNVSMDKQVSDQGKQIYTILENKYSSQC